MISQSIIYFSILGASLGFVHTVLGPDHYIPFIFMAKARKWTMRKTSLITSPYFDSDNLEIPY